MADHLSDEVSKNITREDPITQRPRGSRSVKESGHSGIRKSKSNLDKQIAKAKLPTYPKLKTKFPSPGPVGILLVEPQYKLSFEVVDNLEVLCHDSGMRRYWFRYKVLQLRLSPTKAFVAAPAEAVVTAPVDQSYSKIVIDAFRSTVPRSEGLGSWDKKPLRNRETVNVPLGGRMINDGGIPQSFDVFNSCSNGIWKRSPHVNRRGLLQVFQLVFS